MQLLNPSWIFSFEVWKMEKGKLKKNESFELPSVSEFSMSFLLSSEMIKPFSVDNWQLLSNG